MRMTSVLSVIGLVSLGVALQAGIVPEARGETYDECVQRVEKFKKRRRAGREVGQRLAEAECAPLRVIQLEDGTTMAAPVSTPDMPPDAVAARQRVRPVSPVPRPEVDQFPPLVLVPDRWRIVDSLGYKQHWWDAYNRKTWKGDAPVVGRDGFVAVTLTSDTLFEPRRVVTPVGFQSTSQPGKLDVFGGSHQNVFAQTLLAELVYYKGNTTFRPPDYEVRITPAFNYNAVSIDEVLGLKADPAAGRSRYEGHVGLQSAFFDYHLRNVSERYDFDSIRVGIQPYTHDFRGFLFNDAPFGVRLFGTRDNNIFQYNLGWFRRMEKDTNSGLNDVGAALRKDDLLVANLYWQDLVAPGFTSLFSLLYNSNRESEIFYDANRFIARPASFGDERPREYEVLYLGSGADGHLGRLNLSAQVYAALGSDEHAPFIAERADIRAFFAAAEAGFDMDWIRWRWSMAWASGDRDPFDDVSGGFDAVFENPLFAGADTSYWIRQSVPLIAGGRVAIAGRNGMLNSLRSSKEQGQSNFTNPGLRLLGFGADLDLLPELRLSFNLNQLWFDQTAVLEAARNQGDIDRDIGVDASFAVIWRPWMHQNVVVRLSYARLLPGDGYRDLFLDDAAPYSGVANILLTY